MDSVRIDKWLWAARFFKTRAQAARACDLGRIECNRQPAKPAREIHPGDLLQIRTEADQFEVEVLLLSAIRGPASVAQTLYRETDASREAADESRRRAPRIEELLARAGRSAHQAGPPQNHPVQKPGGYLNLLN